MRSVREVSIEVRSTMQVSSEGHRSLHSLLHECFDIYTMYVWDLPFRGNTIMVRTREYP